jgi:class 3 adenylate cyclase
MYDPNMPIYMDVHRNLGDVTEEDIRAAHQRDLEVQTDFGVHFLTFWFNQPDGQAFCLVEAPDKEAAVACHKHAHGLVPHDMIEVERPTVSLFMGEWEANIPDVARVDGPGSAVDSGLRAIMFTDLEGSTAVSSRDGDERAMEVIERHDEIVRNALADADGREVKHTGDGILACFDTVSRAMDCAVTIQQGFAAIDDHRLGGCVTIGISAGEPVDRDQDIYGAVVNLAARICGHAEPGQTLVSAAVKEMSIGKSFDFIDRGPITLKGFDDPVRLYQVGAIS